jgi:hypothetical protein
LHALRINKQWYAARLKKTAWPSLHIDSLMHSLRDDNYDNPAHRRMRIALDRTSTQRLLELLPPPSLEAAAASNVATASAASAVVAATAESAAAAEPVGPIAPASSPAAVTSSAPAAASVSSESSPAPLVSPSCALMWRSVRDVHVSCAVECFINEWRAVSRYPPPFERIMDGLARLPHLQVLNLSGFLGAVSPISLISVQHLYSSVAGRLEALVLSLCSPSFFSVESLPLLASSLRVLVLDSYLDAKALLPLTRLEYLHVGLGGKRGPQEQAEADALGSALRHLSSVHSLRALSLDSSITMRLLLLLTRGLDDAALDPRILAHYDPNRLGGTMDGLLPVLPSDQLDAALPSRLTDLTVSGSLSYPWQLETACAGLPSLARLHLVFPERYCWASGSASSSIFARMHELRLILPPERKAKCVVGLNHLAACEQLRVLQVEDELHAVSLELLTTILSRNARTLEELRFLGCTAIAVPLGTKHFAPVKAAAALCTRLRIVQLAAHERIAGVVECIRHAPSLHSLELCCPAVASKGGLSALLKVPLLRLMSDAASSPHWCSTRIHLARRELVPVLGSVHAIQAAWKADTAAVLPNASASAGNSHPDSHGSVPAASRLRVFVQRDAVTHCFALRCGEDSEASSSLQWQLEYTERHRPKQ